MSETKAKCRRIDIETESQVWLAISIGASIARELGLEKPDCVRVETVVSEIAHNLLLHGGGGTISIETVSEQDRYGLRICAQDSGPGIADISRALQDGYTTQNGLGIGLGVAKRMMDDVAIRSHLGWGTIMTVTKWVDRIDNGLWRSQSQQTR